MDPDGVESQNGQQNSRRRDKYKVNDSQNSINVLLEPGVDSEAN